MPDLVNMYEAVVEEKLKPVVEEAVRMTESEQKEQGKDLTQREFDYVIAYNKHFCRQHLEALGLNVALVPDNPFNLIRERDVRFTVDYLKMFPAYIQNFQELVKQFQSVAEKILATIQGGRNVILLTNHLTFGNIPIIIAVLNAAVRQGNEILNQVYTVLGSSLMTNQQERDFILSISNVLLTQPKTERGRVAGYEDIQDETRMKFGKLFLSFLRSERNDVMPNQTELGKILIIAPSGTRDVIFDNKVVLRNFTQALGLLKTLANKKSGHMLIPIGVNDAEVYSQRIPQKGNVYMEAGVPIDLTQTEVDRNVFPQKFLEELAGLVKDKEGNSIGEWEKGEEK